MIIVLINYKNLPFKYFFIFISIYSLALNSLINSYTFKEIIIYNISHKFIIINRYTRISIIYKYENLAYYKKTLKKAITALIITFIAGLITLIILLANYFLTFNANFIFFIPAKKNTIFINSEFLFINNFVNATNKAPYIAKNNYKLTLNLKSFKIKLRLK